MVLVKLDESLADARAGLVRLGERLSLLLQPAYPKATEILGVLEYIQTALSFFGGGKVTEKWIVARVKERGKDYRFANRAVREVRCVACMPLFAREFSLTETFYISYR
jgi:hypothetical protein